MGQFAQLLQAIAAFLWPVFAFVSLFLFRPQISELLKRLKKGKLLGQEIELNESLVQLESSAIAIAQEVARLPAAEAKEEVTDNELWDTVRRIVATTETSPKAALILLASEVEKEARHVLASVGRLAGRKYVPLSQAIQELDKQYGGLPEHVSEALKLFWEVRNRIIHGGDAAEVDILRALDSGLTILRALQALPRQIYTVKHTDVQLFKDAEAKSPVSEPKGVILEAVSTRGVAISVIFPTTRKHFREGKRVAWEWNPNLGWEAMWYRDPETHEILKGWDSSSEFIGRHMDEV
jgi:hypothetical protein